MSKSRKSSSSMGSNGGFSMGCCMRAALAELISCYSLATIAVPASVLFHQYTNGHLTPFDYGWSYAVLTIVLGLTFRNYSWLLSPHIAIMTVFNGWKRMDMGKFMALSIASLVGLGGWFLGAWTVWGLHDGNLHPIASLSNIDSFGVIFFYNMLGMTLQCHLYSLAISAHEWSWKILGYGLLTGLLISRFAPIVGGFFNLWASLAFQLIFGNWGSTQFWSTLLATLLAPFLTAILVMGPFSSKATAASNTAGGGDESEEE